jgi:hypothetical protein
MNGDQDQATTKFVMLNKQHDGKFIAYIEIDPLDSIGRRDLYSKLKFKEPHGADLYMVVNSQISGGDDEDTLSLISDGSQFTHLNATATRSSQGIEFDCTLVDSEGDQNTDNSFWKLCGILNIENDAPDVFENLFGSSQAKK